MTTGRSDPRVSPAVLAPGHRSRRSRTRSASIVLTRAVSEWAGCWVSASRFGLVLVLTVAIGYLLAKGVGIWGINIPVGWGFAIVNFVWWIGIGHAGTFISAFLLLLRQDWRTIDQSICRSDDALRRGVRGHVPAAAPWPAVGVSTGCCRIRTRCCSGRSSAARWCGMFLRSHICHGVAAVLVCRPDSGSGDAARPLAEPHRAGSIYGMLSMGWRGSARTGSAISRRICCSPAWRRRWWSSVHSVVGMDFAARQVPGWHCTIFPPYFVAGAIFSRLCDGADAGHSAAAFLWPGRFHHPPPYRKLRQAHARHRPDRRLRLRHRSVHGLVQRQRL